MRTTLSVLALAAGAAATGFRNFPPFNCPANTDNKCTESQKPGFSFEDLIVGPVNQYKDFNWKGFTCGNAPAGPGGRFGRRTGGKFLSGSCTSDKRTSPSFGAGGPVDKFSLGSIHVKPEFDCDLEFHYEMPDGKTCKHRNACKKSGTTVVNNQCGGAKNVIIVFPPQPSKPKPTCSIDISTISFDCNPPATTKPATSLTTSTVATTTSTPPVNTPPTLPPFSTPVVSSTPPAETSSKIVPPAESSKTVPPGVESSATVPPVVESSKTVPPVVESSKTVPPVVQSSVTVPPVVESSQTVPPVVESSKTVPPVVASSSTLPVNSQPTTVLTTSEITTTVVTSFETTSTIFSTVVSTITSCAPTIPNCPANSIKTTVVTVAVSTTICPVTETLTTVLTTTTSNVVVPPPVTIPTTSKAVVVPGTSTTSVLPGTTTAPAPPVETLPCPGVVPACLNTFLFSVSCRDNSDAPCYCPDSLFFKNVLECVYAHGETETVVSEAIVYLQGICAPFVPSNPGIATGVPTYVSAPPTAIVPIYTTVTVDATTVVPCTDDAGVVIPSSSSTVVISTTLTVPQVGFTTQSGTVGVIPVTQAPFPVQTGAPGGAPGGGFGGAPGAPGGGSPVGGAPGFPATTSFATAPIGAPIGTGGLRPTATGAVVTAGGGRVSAGLGFSLGMAIFAVMGL